MIKTIINIEGDITTNINGDTISIHSDNLEISFTKEVIEKLIKDYTNRITIVTYEENMVVTINTLIKEINNFGLYPNALYNLKENIFVISICNNVKDILELYYEKYGIELHSDILVSIPGVKIQKDILAPLYDEKLI